MQHHDLSITPSLSFPESLAVYVKPKGEGVTDEDEPLFKETEHKGTSWQHGKMDVPVQEKEYEVGTDPGLLFLLYIRT